MCGRFGQHDAEGHDGDEEWAHSRILIEAVLSRKSTEVAVHGSSRRRDRRWLRLTTPKRARYIAWDPAEAVVWSASPMLPASTRSRQMGTSGRVTHKREVGRAGFVRRSRLPICRPLGYYPPNSLLSGAGACMAGIRTQEVNRQLNWSSARPAAEIAGLFPVSRSPRVTARPSLTQ